MESDVNIGAGVFPPTREPSTDSDRLDTASLVIPETPAGEASLKKQAADLTMRTMAIYFSFAATEARIRSLGKVMLSYSYYLPALFTQSVCTGFESTMTKLREDSPLDRQLADLQKEIWDSMSSIDEHKRRVADTFTEAYRQQGERFEIMDEHLAKVAATGDDFLWNPKKLPGAFDRRTRALFVEDKSFLKEILQDSIDIAQKKVSAGTSAALVSIDSAGRFIGEELAIISAKMLGAKIPKAFANHAIPVILTGAFLWHEVNETILEIAKETAGSIYSTFFYPIVAGIATGLYEGLEKSNPGTMPKFLKKEPSYSEIAASAFDTETAYDLAKKYYKKYDDLIEDSDVSAKSLIKNPTAAKRLMDARRAAYQLCDKHQYLLFLTKKLTDIRPLFLASKVFYVKLVYLTIKTTTKIIAKPIISFGSFLANSIMKGVSSVIGKEDTDEDDSPRPKAE